MRLTQRVGIPKRAVVTLSRDGLTCISTFGVSVMKRIWMKSFACAFVIEASFMGWTVPTSRFGHGRLFASRILDSSVARSIQRSTSVFMTS